MLAQKGERMSPIMKIITGSQKSRHTARQKAYTWSHDHEGPMSQSLAFSHSRHYLHVFVAGRPPQCNSPFNSVEDCSLIWDCTHLYKAPDCWPVGCLESWCMLTAISSCLASGLWADTPTPLWQRLQTLGKARHISVGCLL